MTQSPQPAPPIAPPEAARPPRSAYYSSRPRSHGQRGLKQAYEFRDMAASHAEQLKSIQTANLKDRTVFAGALRDLFAVWDGARQAIRVYKGQGNPKPVEAKNGAGRKRARSAVAPPPASEPTS